MSKDTLYKIYNLSFLITTEEPEAWKKTKTGLRYRCCVFDDNYNYRHGYFLYHDTHRGKPRLLCECVAGMNEHCRHRDMLKMFLRLKLVNSRLLYNYALRAWIDPDPDVLEILKQQEREEYDNGTDN